MKTKAIIIAAFTLISTSLTHAAVLAFQATGTVTTNRVGGYFQPGDTATMLFSYDDSATGSVNVIPGGQQGSYLGIAQGVLAMRLSIDATGGQWDSTSITGNIAVGDKGDFNDSFQVSSLLPPTTATVANAQSPEGFKIEFTSPVGNPFTDVSLPSTLNAADWGSIKGTIYYGGFSFFENVSIDFTDIQPAVVPESSTYAAFAGLAMLGLVVLRRRRA